MAGHFHAPESIEEALRLSRELQGVACFIAGGTEVNNRHARQAPEHLIWLGRLGLGGISRRGRSVSIGAMVPLQEILESDLVHPAVRQAASNHANRNIRNVATLGGHLGVGRSCADLIPTLLALGARLRVATDNGEIERKLESWVSGERDGLVLSVELSDPPRGLRVALEHYSRTANDVSLLTAAVSFRIKAGGVQGAIVAVGGVAPTVVRLRPLEVALEGRPLPARDELEASVEALVDPVADLRGSAAFKRHLAATLVERALRHAWNQEGHG
jgi:putative selenate reductase FAD-binding subunit